MASHPVTLAHRAPTCSTRPSSGPTSPTRRITQRTAPMQRATAVHAFCGIPRGAPGEADPAKPTISELSVAVGADIERFSRTGVNGRIGGWQSGRCPHLKRRLVRRNVLAGHGGKWGWANGPTSAPRPTENNSTPPTKCPSTTTNTDLTERSTGLPPLKHRRQRPRIQKLGRLGSVRSSTGPTSSTLNLPALLKDRLSCREFPVPLDQSLNRGSVAGRRRND